MSVTDTIAVTARYDACQTAWTTSRCHFPSITVLSLDICNYSCAVTTRPQTPHLGSYFNPGRWKCETWTCGTWKCGTMLQGWKCETWICGTNLFARVEIARHENARKAIVWNTECANVCPLPSRNAWVDKKEHQISPPTVFLWTINAQ